MHKRHPLQPAQPRHANDGAPRTRKQYQQEHRPQQPTKRSDPTQHAKRRTGDCLGPRKQTATRRNVTQGGGSGGIIVHCCGGKTNRGEDPEESLSIAVVVRPTGGRIRRNHCPLLWW